MLNTHTTKATQMGLCYVGLCKIMPDLPTLTATKLAAEPKQPQNKPQTNHSQHHTFTDKQVNECHSSIFQQSALNNPHPKDNSPSDKTTHKPKPSAQLTKPTATQSQRTRLQKRPTAHTATNHCTPNRKTIAKTLMRRKTFSTHTLAQISKVCQNPALAQKSAANPRSTLEKSGLGFEWRFSEVLI